VTTLAREMPAELHAVDDVVRTNAFGVTLGGRRCKALYPEIAVSQTMKFAPRAWLADLTRSQRINHGCDPK